MHKIQRIIIIVKIILLTTCLTTALTACQSKNKSEKKMNIEQPNYYIKLHMQDCVRIVTVNGFEIERDFAGDSSAAEIPINHLIKNGDNYFELMVPGQEYFEDEWSSDSNCAVEVRVSGKVSGESIDYKVADIVFSADYSAPSTSLTKNSMATGTYQFVNETTELVANAQDSVVSDIKVLPNYINGLDGVFQRSFTANVPFPQWAFFDGDILFDGYHPKKNKEEYHSAKAVVWPKVEELWDLFEAKQLDKILPLFEFRSKEYDQAFYREPGNTLEQLKNSLENVYASKYPIDRVDNKQMQLVVSFANNLVTIVNAGTNNGTVMFYDHESDSHTFYNVYWMKKDGEWIISR
jgi:hypothetical protein